MLANLNQRAALQSRTLTPDGGGGYSESWQTTAAVWIAVTPLGASERFGADAVETRIRHRIVLRARNDVVSGMRLLTGRRNFAIRAVLERDATEPLLTLLCEELP